MNTINKYNLPFPVETKITKIVKDSPAHTGAFKGAIDFAMTLGTDVLAPLSGTVIKVEDNNTKYGNSFKYANYLNYIDIQHKNGEISELAHLAVNSVVVKVGDFVSEGQKLALTGLSGWMTEPHLHWLVYRKNVDNE